ncbi:MAG: type IV pilus modification protein PilV [Betaproteobacteria bacterium]|nr:type IV pilus modification protein PilV [Betaproteobacteria bacterium]
MRRPMRALQASRGFSLIEVLVAIVVVVVGLLGLAGMQARAQLAEFESYQRAQALVLLYDMMDRINNNKATASCFAATTSSTFYGDAGNPPTLSCSVSSPANNSLAVGSMTQWHNLLQGSAELKGASATQVGAMIGARGCVTYDVATEYINATTGVNIGGTGEYTVAVSWQGMADTFAPTKTCGGAAQYGSETKRRTVWATMRIATLVAQ